MAAQRKASGAGEAFRRGERDRRDLRLPVLAPGGLHHRPEHPRRWRIVQRRVIGRADARLLIVAAMRAISRLLRFSCLGAAAASAQEVDLSLSSLPTHRARSTTARSPFSAAAMPAPSPILPSWPPSPAAPCRRSPSPMSNGAASVPRTSWWTGRSSMARKAPGHSPTALTAAPRKAHGRNAIGNALAVAEALIESNALQGHAQGHRFLGRQCLTAGAAFRVCPCPHERAWPRNIVINGLAILCRDCTPAGRSTTILKSAFADTIIGGAGQAS